VTPDTGIRKSSQIGGDLGSQVDHVSAMLRLRVA